MSKHPYTLQQRYKRADAFRRMTVIRGHRSTGHGDAWLVVGPGVKWLGQPFTDYDQAITFATFHALKLAMARAHRARPSVT